MRFRTYEVLKEEVANPRLRWAYLPYSMHMAGPREAIQHMIIRRNYGQRPALQLVHAAQVARASLTVVHACPPLLQQMHSGSRAHARVQISIKLQPFVGLASWSWPF